MQDERRKEKAKQKAAQKKYFGCTHCLQGFESQKDLDDHSLQKHIFICGSCFKIFPEETQRDSHMVKEHKAQLPSKKLTKQEKLLVKEWQKRMSRQEKDRRAKQEWDETWVAYVASKKQEIDEERRSKKAKTKEEADAAAGNYKDEDKDYHPSEDAGDRSSIDPSYEPTRKDLKDANKEGD